MSKVLDLVNRPVAALDDLGGQMRFYVRSLAWSGRTLTRYKKEVVRLLAEVSLGTGALSVIGGTVGVIAFLAFFTGTEVGLQGYSSLEQLGTGAFTGFFSAYLNTREIAPLVAGLALAATVGCGFTAQLGAMRISEEVIAVIPLYVLGLLSSYAATRFIATAYFGQSEGTYDHYFHLFLPPGDVFWSFAKVMVFAVVIILIHCYYGYTASGGPAGVGVAVGTAVRTSIVAINIVDFFLSLAIWGATTSVRIAG